MHLTDIAIRNLVAPENTQVTYTDDTLPGFGVRVSKGGAKSFVLVHGRSRRRTTLGRYPIITLAQARAKAKQLLAAKTLGRHAPQTTTFTAALDLYLPALQKRNKPSTVYSTSRLLNTHFLPRFRHDKLEEITPTQIAEKLDDLANTPSEARHAYVALHTFFHWCERRHFVSQSPCNSLQAPAPHVSRSRVLSDQELVKVASKALIGKTVFHKIVALLLLTGQRRGQVAALRGEWVHRAEKYTIYPPEIMKGNREHLVPYGDLAEDILAKLPEAGLFFPATGTDNPYTRCISRHTSRTLSGYFQTHAGQTTRPYRQKARLDGRRRPGRYGVYRVYLYADATF
jgi:integrase